MPGTSGPTSRTPFAFYDPATRSLRTSQITFDLGLAPSSPTLPSSGSMRNGRLYARPTSAPLTGASGCSSSPLLKTPTAQLAINGGTQHPDKRKAGGHGPTLADEVEHLLPTPRARDHKGRDPNPRGVDLNESVALLPTPTTSENRGTGALDGPRNDTLRAQVMLLPTPKATNNENRQSLDRYGPNLGMALQALSGVPTPSRSAGGSESLAGQLQLPESPPPAEESD